MGAQHNVFENAHSLEQGDILEGSSDTESRYSVRREFCDILAVKNDLSRLKRIDLVDAIDEGGFAGPVGADDGHYFSLIDL